MQKQNSKQVVNVGADFFAKIKPSYTLQELYDKNKQLPIPEDVCNNYFNAIKFSINVPFNRYQKFYDKDLTLDQIFRIGYKLNSIENMPNLISDNNNAIVNFGYHYLHIYETGECGDYSIIFEEIKPVKIALAAVRLLDKMGFMLWYENNEVAYIADEINENEVLEDEDEVERELIKLDYKYWTKTCRYNKIVKTIEPEDAVITLENACCNPKLSSELKLWLGMILFLYERDFTLGEFDDYTDEAGEIGPHPSEMFQIRLRRDRIFNELENMNLRGYDDYPRPFYYQTVYYYDDDFKTTEIAYDNSDWCSIKPHEIVAAIFNYHDWYYLSKEKQYQNANLDAIRHSFQTIQSYFDLRAGTNKIRLHRDFERYERKVIRLQKSKYPSGKRANKNDE